MLSDMRSPDFSQDAVRQQLERILAHATFVRNERLSRFLRFIVEGELSGRSSDLKESVLGVEVFGRSPGYDPKQDAVVRTEAIRLRAKLKRYYETDGQADPVIIDLPKGGYAPNFEVPPAPAPPETRTRRGVRWEALAAIAASLVIGAFWWAVSAKPTPIAIAVLPFENLSANAAEDYFSDGLTDELIHNLSIIEGLEVRSRSSAFALKGEQRDVRKAGERLAVSHILEGSVLRENRRLRINVQLVSVNDDRPVWSKRFDRDLADVFAIQEEISLGIVNELRLALGKGRRKYETSVEAYDWYLRARTRETLPSVHAPERIAALERAIVLDPAFAPAYAALASLYAIRSNQFPLDHDDSELRKMRSLADKALQLDPLLAEVHDALGLADAREGRWEQAEARFRRSIELDPNRSTTYVHYSMWLLRVLGRTKDAIRELQIALRFDPLSQDVHGALGDQLIDQNKYDEAAMHCERLPRSDPYRARCFARVELGKGRTEKAIGILETDPTVPGSPLSRGTLGYAHAILGHREIAEKMAAGTKLPNEQALIYAGLRDRERTLDALNRMAILGPQRLGMFFGYPELQFLEKDPAIAALKQKIGLPH